MKEIIIGTELTKTILVDRTNLASTVGSGDLDVFATPMMIALMENASAACLGQFLDDGETSVGTFISTSHIAATPLKMNVSASAVITAVNGREVEFTVTASDDKGKIGEGTHKRFVVFSEKFQAKANSKLDA